MAFVPNQTPSCYGDSKCWSATAKECAGGLDPGYQHPVSGSHVRERCYWFAQCAQESAAARIRLQTSAMHPASIPIAPVAPMVAAPRPIPQGPAPRPAYGVAPQYPQYPQHPQYSYPQYPAQTQNPYAQYAPPFIAQMGPQVVPMVFQQPGSQIPGYLTVPEPIDPNEHWFSRLIREILRSMFKSGCHTTASFVDHTPWRRYVEPELPQLPPVQVTNASGQKGPQ